jgi:hypothetical protein
MRALGGSARLRVEGDQNARWLLGRWQHSFVFKSSEPIRIDFLTASSTFQVPYGSLVSRLMLERLLGTIPEVTLLAESD